MLLIQDSTRTLPTGSEALSKEKRKILGPFPFQLFVVKSKVQAVFGYIDQIIVSTHRVYLTNYEDHPESS